MKKIFTLIAVAFVALSVNAKYQLDLSDLSSGWGATYDAATKTITYEAGLWGGKGWMMSGFDAETQQIVNPFDFSAYDYVVVEIEESSLKANLVAEYTDGVTLNDEKNGIFCRLESDEYFCWNDFTIWYEYCDKPFLWNPIECRIGNSNTTARSVDGRFC